MKLTLKCLIDFRSWLGENHDIRMWEFKELPEFVQNAYYMEFFNSKGIFIETSLTSEAKLWRSFDKSNICYYPLFKWDNEDKDYDYDYNYDFNSVLKFICKVYNEKFS